jgi:hypothetical protein
MSLLEIKYASPIYVPLLHQHQEVMQSHSQLRAMELLLVCE